MYTTAFKQLAIGTRFNISAFEDITFVKVSDTSAVEAKVDSEMGIHADMTVTAFASMEPQEATMAQFEQAERDWLLQYQAH